MQQASHLEQAIDFIIYVTCRYFVFFKLLKINLHNYMQTA